MIGFVLSFSAAAAAAAALLLLLLCCCCCCCCCCSSNPTDLSLSLSFFFCSLFYLSLLSLSLFLLSLLPLSLSLFLFSLLPLSLSLSLSSLSSLTSLKVELNDRPFVHPHSSACHICLFTCHFIRIYKVHPMQVSSMTENTVSSRTPPASSQNPFSSF